MVPKMFEPLKFDCSVVCIFWSFVIIELFPEVLKVYFIDEAKLANTSSSGPETSTLLKRMTFESNEHTHKTEKSLTG